MLSVLGATGCAARAIPHSGFLDFHTLSPRGVPPPFAARFISPRKLKIDSGRTASSNLTTQNHLKYSIKDKTTRDYSNPVEFQFLTANNESVQSAIRKGIL